MSGAGQLDLTTVSLFGGLWTTWMPNAFFQRWPVCWWLALIVDHASRRAMGFMIFRKPPTSQAIQKFLDRTNDILLADIPDSNLVRVGPTGRRAPPREYPSEGNEAFGSTWT